MKNINNKKNLTVAYIRDELRHNRWCSPEGTRANLFDAVEFLLDEYDLLMVEYRKVAKQPREFHVVKSSD